MTIINVNVSDAPVPDGIDRWAFKFRAEAPIDVWRALLWLYESCKCFTTSMSMEVNEHGEPTVGMRVVRLNPDPERKPLYVPVPIEEIRRAFGEVVDCHVIAQTLNYAEVYTGEHCHTDYGSATMDVRSFSRPKLNNVTLENREHRLAFLVAMLAHVQDPQLAVDQLNAILTRDEQPLLTEFEVAQAKKVTDRVAALFGE